MRTRICTLALALVALQLGACAFSRPQALYQYATLGSLKAGVYDGLQTVAGLHQHGTFGLGTFAGLDGELVMVDGAVYQVTVDGEVHHPPPDTRIPFAVVHPFAADATADLDAGLTLAALEVAIDARRVSDNLFYAVRIDATFPALTVRSVPAQQRPYPPLAAVIPAEQQVFELTAVEGTLVGYWCPAYAAGINAAGYHFHFISRDRQQGGHVLDLETGPATRLQLDVLTRVIMDLPDDGPFLDTELFDQPLDHA